MVGSKSAGRIPPKATGATRYIVRLLPWRLHRRAPHINQRATLVTQQNARSNLYHLCRLYQCSANFPGSAHYGHTRKSIAQIGTDGMVSHAGRDVRLAKFPTAVRPTRSPPGWHRTKRARQHLLALHVRRWLAAALVTTNVRITG